MIVTYAVKEYSYCSWEYRYYDGTSSKLFTFKIVAAMEKNK